MNASQKRRMEELVDAVVVGMSDSDEDELFEAFINRPHGCFSESICGDDFEKQKLSRRDELESALKNCLDDKGRDVLSGYTEVVEEYWSTVGRGYFRLAVRLGRVLERQREAEQLLANRGRKTP
ncbi:MAG: hypothetical protein E6J74_04995 [Deltaproteobacteria bacterium]|nr:MAG: hypothetical protein E6J74_04995 [Deltaproteobacteria bacterium]